MVEAHKTCCVFPKTLMTGSLSRKLANMLPENMLNIVESQQAKGCFLEKYNEPKCASGVNCQLIETINI